MSKHFIMPGCHLGSLPIEVIDEGERYRKDYGDLSELCYSIKTHGLINPIAVTPSRNNPEIFTLVAGGRRLAAMRHLEFKEIPVRIFPDALNELDLRILELAENLQRKEMTWFEENNLQRQIHFLQRQKCGEPVKGDVEKKGWSISNTAEMLGVSESQVKQSIQIAEKFEKYAPVLGDISKYKTENDARKAIKTVEEAMVRAELAKRAAKKNETSNMLSFMSSCYHIGDVIEFLKQFPNETFNFCECDPPYGINLHEVKQNNDCEDYVELAPQDFIIKNTELLKEIHRVLKKDTFCVFWFAIHPWIETVYKLALENNFTTTRNPMIWIKKAGQSLNPSYSLASAFETALVLKKGQPILARPGRINIFDYAPVPANKKFHPTQKPLELYEDIYQTFSFEGAECICPFAGSGASLIGAQLAKRKAVGTDLSKKFKEGYLEWVSKVFMEKD